MNKKIKQEKGVTMVALIVTIIIIFILTGMLVYNAQDSADIQIVTDLYNDIGLLQDKVSEFYEKYGEIPANIKYTNIDNLKNANILSASYDTGDFYVIDLEAMEGITLNYGKDYEQVKNNPSSANTYTDIYIINENSHNIFYVAGITVSENNSSKTYYTNYDTADSTTINLKYIDGIKIPDNYYYIGKTLDGDIVISTETEEIDISKDNQFIWHKQTTNLIDIPSEIVLTEEQDQEEFINSVNIYQGYFINTNNYVVYIEVKENKWSEKYTQNAQYIDKNGDVAYIPKGFYVSLSEGTNEIRKGLVITDKIDAETNESAGNEFVWIPTEYIDEFSRYDYGVQKIEDDDFVITEPTEGKYYEISNDQSGYESDQQLIQEIQNLYNSIKTYRGFYIGRYETGITVDSARTIDTAREETPIVQRNKRIYNYITHTQAINVARNINVGDSNIEKANQTFNTTLCYGVEWDSIMRWISKDSSVKYILNYEKNQADSENKTKGNYRNAIGTTAYSEIFKIKNIYDLAGNVAEWTMETYGQNQKVARGGKINTTQPVTYRDAINSNISSNEYGFRVAMYLK